VYQLSEASGRASGISRVTVGPGGEGESADWDDPGLPMLQPVGERRPCCGRLAVDVEQGSDQVFQRWVRAGVIRPSRGRVHCSVVSGSGRRGRRPSIQSVHGWSGFCSAWWYRAGNSAGPRSG
jgi:hypothetical protein